MQEGETRIFWGGAQDILTASIARARRSEVIYKTKQKKSVPQDFVSLTKNRSEEIEIARCNFFNFP